MKWICSDCGKDARDHTLRELNDGHCHQDPPRLEAEPWTATELHFINPEAIENTGEEFDLKFMNAPKELGFRAEVPCRACGEIWKKDAIEPGDLALAWLRWRNSHGCPPLC